MVAKSLPHLVCTTNSKQLVVNGQPFLVRGAELQNSSFSSAKHMSTLWPKLREMNCNTILGSVAWEAIEPNEGHFTFEELDQIIIGAREAGLKLILLWFGAWKNGISTYAPAWMKMAPTRFPRVIIRERDGKLKTTEILSCLHEETRNADARAFRALMQHLKQMDESHSTVIMVQVENEVGVLGDSRDRSQRATDTFNAAVPADFMQFLTAEWCTLHQDLKDNLNDITGIPSGRNWADAFGDNTHTDEMFMAYHFAKHVEYVARLGKQEYPLPMFANFWLNYGQDQEAMKYPVLAGGGDLPGDYPSGGAVSTVLDIWMHFAPSLDMLCPDTYLNDYHRVCSTYRHKNQPLFIPEQRRDEHGARRMWAAVGRYLALGTCPFGVDTLEPIDCAYTHHYDLLGKCEDIILEAQRRENAIFGFFFDDQDTTSLQSASRHEVKMNGYHLLIERAFVTGNPGPGYGAIIACTGTPRGPGTARFILVGAGFQVKFTKPNTVFTGILDFIELDRAIGSAGGSGNAWTRLRRLNGDETRSGQQAIMPNFFPDDGGFPINITIPAVTRLAECNVYHI